MDLFFPFLSSVLLCVIVVGANLASLEPQIYWRTILPHTPMPSAIEHLLQPDMSHNKQDTGSSKLYATPLLHYKYATTDAQLPDNKPDTDNSKLNAIPFFNYHYAATDTQLPDNKPDTGSSKLSATPLLNYNYAATNTQLLDNKTDTGNSKLCAIPIFNYHYAATDTQLPDNKPDTGSSKLSATPLLNYDFATTNTQLPDNKTDTGGSKLGSTHMHLNNNPATAIFFLQQDLHRVKQFTLQLADGGSAPTAFIPRSLAESVPFSTTELPAILSQFGIHFGSTQATAMEQTLRMCEVAPVAGEKKLCATSLESMVDFVMTSLRTREVAALATEGDGSAGELQVYKVGSVRTVAEARGKGVVSCHPMSFPYAVFSCHATSTTVVYEVEMVVKGGGTRVKVVAVCHMNTADWNPNHLAFRVLNVKPGTVPVCHFMPQDHVLWTVLEKVSDV